MAMNNRLMRPRASGFSPKSIAGLQLWLDAADSSTITLNGSNVSEWRDKSANAVAVSQATANNQPSYESAYVNGRNAIKFGGNDWLFQSSLTLASTALTIFAVVREDSHADNSGSYVFGPATGNDYTDNVSNFMEYGNTAQLVGYNNTGSITESGSGTMPLSVCVFNVGSTNATVRRNGTQTGSGAHSRSGSSANLTIGARFLSDAPSVYYASNQTFCELVRYGSSLTADAQGAVEKYLARKWGVTLA